MITHLIPMTDFIKLVRSNLPLTESIGNAVKFTQLITKYANFITQKATIELILKYFKNWKYVNKESTLITDGDSYLDEEFLYNTKSLEYLMSNCKFELTDIALKQIGL
jgi:hypothetical protein